MTTTSSLRFLYIFWGFGLLCGGGGSLQHRVCLSADVQSSLNIVVGLGTYIVYENLKILLDKCHFWIYQKITYYHGLEFVFGSEFQQCRDFETIINTTKVGQYLVELLPVLQHHVVNKTRIKAFSKNNNRWHHCFLHIKFSRNVIILTSVFEFHALCYDEKLDVQKSKILKPKNFCTLFLPKDILVEKRNEMRIALFE